MNKMKEVSWMVILRLESDDVKKLMKMEFIGLAQSWGYPKYRHLVPYTQLCCNLL